MTLTEEIAEIIGQMRENGYSNMVAAEAVVALIMERLGAAGGKAFPEPPARKERDDD